MLQMLVSYAMKCYGREKRLKEELGPTSKRDRADSSCEVDSRVHECSCPIEGTIDERREVTHVIRRSLERILR